MDGSVRRTIVIAGSARLPAKVALPGGGSHVCVEVEIDRDDEEIVDVACVCMSRLGEKVLQSVLIGRKVGDGLGEMVKELKTKYLGGTQKAVIAAIEDVYHRYRENGRKA